jgi:hypothetical protein
MNKKLISLISLILIIIGTTILAYKSLSRLDLDYTEIWDNDFEAGTDE